MILSSLAVIVKGAWWAAAVQPVLLGLGAAFATIDLDIQHNNFTWPDFPTWNEIWTDLKDFWRELNGE